MMSEIAAVCAGYAGVTFARLERGGVNVPATSPSDPASPILAAGPDGRASSVASRRRGGLEES